MLLQYSISHWLPCFSVTCHAQGIFNANQLAIEKFYTSLRYMIKICMQIFQICWGYEVDPPVCKIFFFKYKYYLYTQTYYGYSGGILYRDRYHIILQHVNWQWDDWDHSVIVKLWGASTNECTPSKVLELSESIFEGSIVIVPTYWTRKNPFL